MTTTDHGPRPALLVPDLQVALGLGRDTVLAMLSNGELPGIRSRPGGKWSVPAAAFDSWCLARGEQAARRSAQVGQARPVLVQSVRRAS